MVEPLIAPSSAAALPALDACWSRIGVRGDGSCPDLAQYIQCGNCPVHARAAARLLDRPRSAASDLTGLLLGGHAGGMRHGFGTVGGAGLDQDDSRDTPHEGQGPGCAALVFRLAGEWLALPAAALEQVVTVRKIHALPHRRNAAVLGVVNVRGTLLTCVSLAELLGIAAAAGASAGRRASPRLLVLGSAAPGGQPAHITKAFQTSAAVVFPVDEIDGIRHVADADHQPVPATVARASAFHTRAIVASAGRQVGLLDAERLLQSLTRSLE